MMLNSIFHGVAALLSVHLVNGLCPRDGTPVQDLCAKGSFVGFSVYFESTSAVIGLGQCTCTLTPSRGNTRVTFYQRSEVTEATCQSFSLAVEGLPDGLSYSWCDGTGTLPVSMTAGTTWSMNLRRTGSATTEPDHCFLVNGALNVTCNEGQVVTRPPPPPPTTTTTTTTTITTTPTTTVKTTTRAPPPPNPTTSPRTPSVTSTEGTTPSTSTPTSTSTETANTTEPNVSTDTGKMTDAAATSTAAPVVPDTQGAIIIGVSLGAVLLLIILIVIVWRKCCRDDKTSDKNTPVIPPVINTKDGDLPNPTPLPSNANPVYATDASKAVVARSHSNPPTGTNLTIPKPITNGTSFITTGLVHADRTSFKQPSEDIRLQQIEVFKQGLKNTERVNSGDTIEANHIYISKVVVPQTNGYSSYPHSRSNSVKRSEDSALRNTEMINHGGTIEAEHKYVTRVGVPHVSGSYYSLPHSRANSFKRPVQITLSSEEALRRKEIWYRNGGIVRHKGPLAYTRNRTGSAYLGAF